LQSQYVYGNGRFRKAIRKLITMFGEMCLFYVASQKHDKLLCERVRGRVWVERVAVWVINLTAGQVFMRV
jgi:hypothetical protein